MFKDFDFSAMYMIFYCHELDIICNVVTTDDDVSITCTLVPLCMLLLIAEEEEEGQYCLVSCLYNS